MANKKARAATSATEALKILWEEQFFVGWRKKTSIEVILAKRDNHFSGAELGMALKRAKHLTRRGKRGNYEYIQKYPQALAPQQSPTSNRKPNARKN
ncbi:MAG TPA: hypothetical protein VFE02_11490 [Candidatus Acidoferrales bacterium]|nr:hypothetical protein [Candidatus Acidoferrales bacterium]